MSEQIVGGKVLPNDRDKAWDLDYNVEAPDYGETPGKKIFLEMFTHSPSREFQFFYDETSPQTTFSMESQALNNLLQRQWLRMRKKWLKDRLDKWLT